MGLPNYIRYYIMYGTVIAANIHAFCNEAVNMGFKLLKSRNCLYDSNFKAQRPYIHVHIAGDKNPKRIYFNIIISI